MSRKPYIRFEKKGFKLLGTIIRDIFTIGLSPFLVHTLASMVTIVMNVQLGRFGGDYAIGAFGIVNSVTSLIVMIVLGLTQGMQPIVGYNFGALRMDRVTQTLKLTIYWATGVAVFGFLVAEIFPEQIVRAFTNDPQMIAITVRGMRIDMIAFGVVGFQVVSSNFFQAIGKAKIAIVLSISRQVLFLMPLLFILPSFFELDGVWASNSSADLLATITTACVLFYFYGKIRKNGPASII